MQARASIRYGAVKAPVGHTSRQRRQAPQWSSSGASGSIAAVVKIEPMNSHDPNSRDTRLVCLPCQPSPARAASGFSITGAVSTKIFTALAASSATRAASGLSLALSTS